ncbi:MAG: hypothetical protein AAFR04_14045, partial [Pseudomonadota bacterium]
GFAGRAFAGATPTVAPLSARAAVLAPSSRPDNAAATVLANGGMRDADASIRLVFHIVAAETLALTSNFA